MTKPDRRTGPRGWILGKIRSPVFWALLAIFLGILATVLIPRMADKGKPPQKIPAEALSKIHQEKARAQEEFAEFIKTPAGKLWQRYPYWDPDLCQKIAEGQVLPGMSKEQAKEAVGAPVEVRRRNQFLEEWVVEGQGKERMILKFEDNVLKTVERK